DRVQDARLPAADRADDADEPPPPPVERRALAVRAEPLDGQLKRAHRPPPPLPGRRRTGPAGPWAAPRRGVPAGSTRRTAVGASGRGASRVSRDRPRRAAAGRAPGTGTPPAPVAPA